PAQMQAAMAQMRQMLAAGDDDDSRWKMAHDAARQVAHSGGDPSVRADEADSVRSLLSVADLWLDAATELPPSGGQHLALSRAEWVSAPCPRGGRSPNPWAPRWPRRSPSSPTRTSWPNKAWRCPRWQAWTSAR